MFNRPYPSATRWPIAETAPKRPNLHLRGQPSLVPSFPEGHTESRHAKLATDEPKRRLIRDARVLCWQRGITQGQMANELGISKRTLEEWMQFRRMLQAPSESLLRQWVARYSTEFHRPTEPAP